MTSLGPFSRERFATEQVEQLCVDLATVLAGRLRASSDRHAEIDTIVAELRDLGHDLWSWDESDEFVVWGGDYMRPQPLRMVLSFEELDGDAPTVEVTWGPWPKGKT